MKIAVITFLHFYAINCENNNTCLNKTERTPYCCSDYEEINGTCVPCGPGYISSYGQPCVQCSEGYYGINCIEMCHCPRRCHHVYGCIETDRPTHDVKDNIEIQDNTTSNTTRHDDVTAKWDSDSNTSIAAGVIFTVFILTIIILGLLIYVIKRRARGRKVSPDTDLESDTPRANSITTNNSIHRDVPVCIELSDRRNQGEMPSGRNPCVSNNIVPKPDFHQTKIPVQSLLKTITDKHRTEEFRREYETLPNGCIYEHKNGEKMENKTKNRFITTLPYDHSRVILKGCSVNNYINASYIDNYKKKKAYIASQGPKENTLRDFWHMVWQENVGIIVMVTRLEELGGKKCDQYWPNSTSEGLTMENYNLFLTTEVEHSVYVYREIKVFDSMTKEERTVQHFHFTQWPDHSIPDKIKLVNFYRKVKTGTADHLGPMIVHCSAGIGRTGTFIAIDSLYDNGKITGYVDVMDYVKMMRKDRMNMVQTVDQYIAIYEALLELFEVPDTSVPKNGFREYSEKQLKQTVPKNQTNLRQEFQRLQLLLPNYTDDDFSAAKATENRMKTAEHNILPHNDYRPYLMSYERSRNDYINAVIIPGYSTVSKFIVTQCPLDETVVDFWTMVYDHECVLVVLLDSCNKNASLWGDGKRDFKNISIRKTQNINADEFEIRLAQRNDIRTVAVLTTMEWKSDQSALPSTNIMMKLLKTIAKHQNTSKGPAVIVCRDGFTRSGLVLALSLAIQKMALDDEVDIFQVVRTMQVRRPEFISAFDQYEYCYRCIKEYLEQDSIHENTQDAK